MKNISPVSVVIPALNEEKYISVLLESLCNINHPMEVIVVDGHSDDKTVDVVESFREKLKAGDKPLTVLISDVRNIATQRNMGAQQAKNDLLLFCDADIEAPNTADFSKMVCNFIQKNYVVASARIVSIEPIVSAKTLLFIAFYIQKLLGLTGRAYCSGAFMLTPKSIFMEACGFDETLRISEDVDYSTRVSKRGRFTIYNVSIKTSMRRVEKYGYSVLYENPRALLDLLTKGKQTEEKHKIHYPFGEF